jgi:hypothetical protein
LPAIGNKHRDACRESPVRILAPQDKKAMKKIISLAAALSLSLAVVGVVAAADGVGYKKPYFAATRAGTWAQYTMKIEGQADMGYTNTRLPDVDGRQQVEVRVEYMLQGKLIPMFTRYTLKNGYALEADALGFGKAVTAMSSRQDGSPAQDMPAATLDAVRKTMPDYAASAQFVGTENVGGKMSDRYKYVQRHPGTPAQIESGELWLSDSVPFGLVRQKAITREESGKVVSQFELLLVDSGAAKAPVDAARSPGGAAGAVALGEAFKTGKVELAVSVQPSPADGSSLSVKFKNKTDAPLKVSIPAGTTTLDVGTPIDKLRLEAAAAKSIELGPNQTSSPVMLTQGGTRRAMNGAFTLSVYEGTPLYSGTVTMDTIKR